MLHVLSVNRHAARVATRLLWTGPVARGRHRAKKAVPTNKTDSDVDYDRSNKKRRRVSLVGSRARMGSSVLLQRVKELVVVTQKCDAKKRAARSSRREARTCMVSRATLLHRNLDEKRDGLRGGTRTCKSHVLVQVVCYVAYRAFVRWRTENKRTHSRGGDEGLPGRGSQGLHAWIPFGD